MATERQYSANRLNALRSTGPKTDEGKATSRLNSLRHGLTARELIIKGEREEEFDDFATEFTILLAPDGIYEKSLVNRIITVAWRLRRAPAFEAAFLNWLTGQEDVKQQTEEAFLLPPIAPAASADPQADIMGRVVEYLVSGSDMLGKLLRYEKALGNEFSKVVAELKAVQAAREALEKKPEAH